MERTLISKNNNNLIDLLRCDSNIINDFLSNIDTLPATKESYKKGVTKFINWVMLNNISIIDNSTIIAYKNYLKSTCKPNSCNMYITSLKKFYVYLETLGIKNITANLKGTKVSKDHKKDPLTIDQVKEIFESFDKTTLEGSRDYALFMLMINTGLRTIEIERANIEDIKNIGNKHVLYVQGKGHDEKDDFVLLSVPVYKAISNYLKLRRTIKGNDPLFISLSNKSNGERLKTRSIRNIVKGYYAKIGLYSDRITTHSTRHTAITFALLAGASLQETQQLARHSNINTTMIYAHNINRLENNAESKIANLLGL